MEIERPIPFLLTHITVMATIAIDKNGGEGHITMWYFATPSIRTHKRTALRAWHLPRGQWAGWWLIGCVGGGGGSHWSFGHSSLGRSIDFSCVCALYELPACERVESATDVATAGYAIHWASGWGLR